VQHLLITPDPPGLLGNLPGRNLDIKIYSSLSIQSHPDEPGKIQSFRQSTVMSSKKVQRIHIVFLTNTGKAWLAIVPSPGDCTHLYHSLLRKNELLAAYYHRKSNLACIKLVCKL